MVLYKFLLTSAVEISPDEYLVLSNWSNEAYPAFFGKSGYFWPGYRFAAMVLAADLPKMTKSKSELAPNLLAPCTLAQAASPAANKPGTIFGYPSSPKVKTSVFQLVGIPPIL